MTAAPFHDRANARAPDAAFGRRLRVPGPWAWTTLAVAALVGLPVLVVLSRVFLPSDGVWQHLAETVLSRYIGNSLALVLGVGAVTLVLGIASAWLVAMCRFPGRTVLEWALLLPMAMPAYVLAYVYTDLLQFSGPLQSGLRAWFGWSRQDYWFPEVRSLPGAIAMLGLAFYPYVYLAARAAFLEQSVCVLEVSRTLGCTPWRAFGRVALPLARPAIVAGLALVLMETLADFGTVQYFAIDTFTTGIYRTWFALGQPVAAAQLAASLLGLVLLVLLVERASRRGAAYHATSTHHRNLPAYRLSGTKAAGALLVCGLPPLLGFLIPATALLRMAMAGGDPLFGPVFLKLARHSLTLASVSAVLAVGFATIVAYGLRLAPSAFTRAAARIASMGYAIPGSVVAVGILIPLAGIDNWLDGLMRARFGISSGLLLSGTMVALIFAYLVRFLAAALNTVEASLGKVARSIDHAARVLGHSPVRTLIRVHAPMMRASLLTATLIVFVDVMKELPATMIVRPFNFDTLAVRVYTLASDERLQQSSTAALAIVAVGILPVILLSRAVIRSRERN